MTVLLMGYPDWGTTLSSLAAAVEDAGGEVIVVEPEDWPGDAPITYGVGRGECVLGRQVDFKAVTGAFVQINSLFHPHLPRFADDFREDPRRAAFVTREYRRLFEGLVGVLEAHDVRTCPPLSAYFWHDRRPSHLQRLRAAGVPVPDTVFTNEAEEVESFVRDHGRVVHKPVTKNAPPGELTPEDLSADRLSTLSTVPVTFQAYVPGRDLRTYVLDGEVVLAAYVPTDGLSYKEQDEVDPERVVPDRDLRETAVLATEAADLTFAAVDLVRRNDGSLSVLEVNPGPGFGFLGGDLRADVAAALASYLLGER